MPNPQIDKVNVNGTLYDIIDSTSPAASISASDITRWNGKISNTYVGYLDSTALYVPKNWFYDQYASTYSYCLFFYAKESVTINGNTLIREIESNSSIATLGNTIYLDGQNKSSGVILSTNRLYAYKYNDGISYIYTVANRSDIPTVPSNISAFTNDAGYISSITSADISNALGYTPTSNTGTVTSVTLSDGGGLSINGSPITTSGTITIGHSNSVTAQTTQAVYPIKIDAQGHVSAYGTAVSIPSTAADVNAVAISAVGASSGVAPLNASGKIDSTYLPSYVDDVIEGYYYNNKFYKESTHTTEITGETGKIYIDLSTDKVYRYGGTAYAEIAQGSLVSVTRDLNSGTQIGTITINGTGTSLYAPTPPSKVSELSNDSGFITGISAADVSTALGYTPYNSTNPNGYVNAAGASAAAPVQSVNSKTGAVTLSAADVGALPSNTTIPTVTDTYSSSGTDAISGKGVYAAIQTLDSSITATSNQAISAITITDGKITSSSKITLPTIPSDVSAFNNDAGYISGISSTDVTTALGYTPISAETDPVFSASPAAGISAADISSWNDKVSDDKTWNGVQLAKQQIESTAESNYLPLFTTLSPIVVSLATLTRTPTTNAIAKYDTSAQLHSTTPSSADNSNTVATTAFVKGAIPSNVSAFSNDAGYVTTDEKLITNLNSTDSEYVVILGASNSTASTKYYDRGIKYQNRSDDKTSRLILGISGTGDSRRQGQIAFYNQDKYCILRYYGNSASGIYINLPSSGGTLALQTDIPTNVSSFSNDAGYITLADLPIYDGTVQTGT